MIVAPFPYDSLPELTRADIAEGARARALASLVPRADLEQALSDVVKAPVKLGWSRARGEIANRVTAAFATSTRDAFAVDVEPALAREVVARALAHPTGIDTGKAARAEVQGAFAAVLHHALRKVGVVSREPLRERATTLRLVVAIAGATFDASVAVPERLAMAPAPVAGGFPVSLSLVAISCLASRGEVAALEAGDTFVPPGWTTPLPSGALLAPNAERGIAVELTSDGRLVIRKDRFAQHSWEPPPPVRGDATSEEPMSEANQTLEVALEAPVVVRVELGAVEMKAREWAALAEGDVITLQRKLGEPAILRIAGTEVARGELVQVDGEYGIRITSTSR